MVRKDKQLQRILIFLQALSKSRVGLYSATVKTVPLLEPKYSWLWFHTPFHNYRQSFCHFKGNVSLYEQI